VHEDLLVVRPAVSGTREGGKLPSGEGGGDVDDRNGAGLGLGVRAELREVINGAHVVCEGLQGFSIFRGKEWN
jgi:hypothetical protein